MKHLAILLAGAALASSSHAASLQSATVTRVINDVRIYSPSADGRNATTGDVIRGRNSLHTGRRSRSELRFQDNTITRLGSNSIFSFAQGTRDLTLEQGTLLLQVPKRAGGARIRTATVTASITGTTILMEYFAGKWVKIIVLEGKLDVFLNAIGRRVTVREGQMMVFRANDRQIPRPVDIDLARNVKTCPLADAQIFGSLPPNAAEAIATAIANQQREIRKGRLVRTNVVNPRTGTRAEENQRRIRDIGREYFFRQGG